MICCVGGMCHVRGVGKGQARELPDLFLEPAMGVIEVVRELSGLSPFTGPGFVACSIF